MQNLAFVTAFLCLTLSAHAADRNSTEEAAIKKQIAAIDADGSKGHSLPDDIFWSGAYKRPVIGNDDLKQYEPGEGGITDRKPTTRKLVTTPQRIIVSDSRDLAYEYSSFTMEFDTKAGKHIHFEGAVLRVWQKQDGEWKQAASFARPYDE